MNRIVIIGNGFDLAHGLKTQYEDFLLWYFKKHFDQAIEKGKSEDKLIKVEKNTPSNDTSYRKADSLDDLQQNFSISFPGIERTKYSQPHLIINYKSRLLREIVIDRNWTDIEKKYFDHILSIQLTSPITIGSESKLSRVQKANRAFELIKQELFNYLTEMDQLGTLKPELIYLLEESFQKNKSVAYHSKMEFNLYESQKPNEVCFINFNYTGLLDGYLNNIRQIYNHSNYTHIPIHGTLQHQKHIIFGYGDETHEHYQLLENLDTQEYLQNIKSFYYPMNSYYDYIMDFINGPDKYDVHIIGHSLGLSDRILLKSIFENKNCKAIRLYHRGTEESQFKKRIALSRHFSNKMEMRKKILQYNEEDKIPQTVIVTTPEVN